MNDLTLEQLQLTRIVDDYANQFPLTEDGDALLLEAGYDYMEAFKYVMDSTSRVQKPLYYPLKKLTHFWHVVGLR